jgi:hypothetical protein
MLNLNLNNDLASADGCETVTITQAGTLEEQTVDNVLCRPVSLNEIELAGGSFSHGDVKFHVPAAELAFVPAAGDSVLDEESNEWNVLAVDLLALESRYRLWCSPA